MDPLGLVIAMDFVGRGIGDYQQQIAALQQTLAGLQQENAALQAELAERDASGSVSPVPPESGQISDTKEESS